MLTKEEFVKRISGNNENDDTAKQNIISKDEFRERLKKAKEKRTQEPKPINNSVLPSVSKDEKIPLAEYYDRLYAPDIPERRAYKDSEPKYYSPFKETMAKSLAPSQMDINLLEDKIEKSGDVFDEYAPDVITLKNAITSYENDPEGRDEEVISEFYRQLDEVEFKRGSDFDYYKKIYGERLAEDVKELSDQELEALIDSDGSVNPLSYNFVKGSGGKFLADTKSQIPKAEKYQREVINNFNALSQEDREAVESVTDIEREIQKLEHQRSNVLQYKTAIGRSVSLPVGFAEAKEEEIAEIDRQIKALKAKKESVKSRLYAYGYSSELADDILSYGVILYNDKQNQKLKEDVKGLSTSGLVGANVASIPANLTSGLGQLDITFQTWRNRYSKDYRPVDYNTPATTPGRFSREVRNETNERIDSDGWRFVYNTTMSIADTATATLAAGHLAPVLLSGSAGLNAIYDAKERGASDIQAVNFGIASAVSEALFEAISIGSFLKPKDIPGAKTFIANMLKQMFTEGTEEVATSVFNDLADKIIMGDKSQFETNVREYMSVGLTREQAEKAAMEDYIQSLGLDFLGGFVSGTVFGGVDSYSRHVVSKEKQAGEKRIKQIEDYETAFMSDAEKTLYHAAEEKMSKNDGMTYNEARISLIEDKLRENGATGDKRSIRAKAEAINNALSGNIARSGINPIVEDKSALNVFNELAGENIAHEGRAKTKDSILAFANNRRTMQSLRSNSALERASTLGENGILAYIELNVPEVYSEEFVRYYDAGLSGMSIRSADKVTGSVMPAYMKSLAHEAGRLDARAYANKNAPDNSGTENVKYSLSPTKRARLEKNIIDLSNASIKKTAGNKSIKISTDQFSVNKAVYSKKGRSDKEVNARIKAIPDFESIIKGSTYSHTDTNIVGLDNAAKKNVIAMHYFKTTYNGFDVEIVVRDKGQKQFLYEVKFIDNKKSSQQSMPKGIDSPAPKGDVENKSIVSQKAKNVKKPHGKAMLKSTSAGFTEGERVAPIDAEGQAFLDKLGKVLGIEITYDDADESKYNGYYINGKMVIARSANVPYLTVVAHETTHRFIESDPEGARAYGNYVIQKMYKGKTLDAEIQRIIDAHRKEGIYMDRAGAMEEICANYTELMLNDVSLFQKLAQKNYNIAHKILDFLKDVLSRINAALPRKNAKVDRYGLNHAQMERAARLWQRALRRSEANVSKSTDSVTESDDNVTENKNTPDDSEVANAKHMLKEPKISVGMSEAERYEVLKNKEIPLKTYNDSKLERYKYIDGQEINVDSLINMKKTDAKKILRLLGEKFEIFKEYYNEDVNLSFEYSKTGLGEGVNKQNKHFDNLAKLLTVMDEVVENAVAVEAHTERYDNTDSNLDTSYVLVSAFENEIGIVPVRMLIKTFTDSTQNTLHMVVSANEVTGDIKKNRSRNVEADQANAMNNPHTRPVPIVSISDLFAKVNIADGDFLKYIPDGFLSSEQQESKKIAIEKERAYIQEKNQRKYSNRDDSQKPEGKASLKSLGEEFADVSVFESGKLKDFTRKKVQRKQLKVASPDEMKSWASSLDGVGYGDFVALRHLFEEACFDVGNEEKINRVIERALQLAVIDAQATFGLKPFEYDADATAYIDHLTLDMIKMISGGYSIPEDFNAKFDIDPDDKDISVSTRFALENTQLRDENRRLQRQNVYYQKKEAGNIREQAAAYENIRKLKDTVKKARREKEYYQKRLKKIEEENRKKIFEKEKNELLKIMHSLSTRKRLPIEIKEQIKALIGDFDTEHKSMKEGSATFNELTKLRESYEAIVAHDPDYSDPHIKAICENLEKRHIDQLDRDEVRKLTDALKAIAHNIKQIETDKFIGMKEERTISEAAGKEMEIIPAAPIFKLADQRLKNPLANDTWHSMFDKFAYTFLTPENGIKRMVGYDSDSMLLKLTLALDEGVDRADKFKIQAQRKFEKFMRDKKFMNDLMKRRLSIETSEGKIDISAGFMISLYLNSKNDDNMRHISGGGITIPDYQRYIRGLESSYDQHAHEKVQITKEQIEEAAKQLSQKELAFAKEVSDYFNNMNKTAINYVSLLLNGYEKATVEKYFPIISDKNYLKQSFVVEGANGLPSLNFGSLNDRKQDANNPVLLFNVVDILTKSINETSLYYGLAIPMHNFKKLYNTTLVKYNAEKMTDRMMQADDVTIRLNQSMAQRTLWRSVRANTDKEVSSLRAVIEKKWGKSANKFIEDFLKDVAGIKAKDERFGAKLIRWLRGNYAKSVLSYNLSTTAVQVSGLAAAGSVVGMDSVVKAYTHRRKVSAYEKSNDVEFERLIEKYSPLLWRRMKGYSEQELGDFANEMKSGIIAKNIEADLPDMITEVIERAGNKAGEWKADKIKRLAAWYISKSAPSLRQGSEEYNSLLEKTCRKIEDKLQADRYLDWLTRMDLWTVKSIWKAAEYHTDKNYKNLDRGTDAYFKQVAKTFNEAVKKTQPNSTVMQRPKIMRHGSVFDFLTFMKSQTYANFNVLYDAYNEYRITRYKLAHSTPVNNPQAVKLANERMRLARNKLRDAILAQMLQSLITAYMRLAAKALLGKTDEYEKEDGTMSFWSIHKEVLGDFVTGMVEPFPFIDLAVNTVRSYLDYGSVTLQGVFDNTHVGMLDDLLSVAGDMLDNADKGEDVINNGIIYDLALGLSQFIGKPVKNVVNVISAPFKLYAEIEAGNGYAGNFAKLAVTHDLYETKNGKKQLTSKAVEVAAWAYINDRNGDFAAIMDEIKKSGVTDKSRELSRVKTKAEKLLKEKEEKGK